MLAGIASVLSCLFFKVKNLAKDVFFLRFPLVPETPKHERVLAVAVGNPSKKLTNSAQVTPAGVEPATN
jgi:hypothetical protein